MRRERNHRNTRAAAPLSKAQEQELLAHVRNRADQARLDGATRAVVDELILSILLHAGLRAQELCALRIVDTPAHHGKMELHVGGRTDAAQRSVSIPEDMIPVFQRFVRLYRAGAKPTDPLLLSERGTPFGYMSLYSKVRRIGQDCGLGRLNAAVLRRTFLMRLYEKERDLRLVQEQAGHARLRSTTRCVRPRRTARLCGACGNPLAPGSGERIDSGQVLCPKCLYEVRNR